MKCPAFQLSLQMSGEGEVARREGEGPGARVALASREREKGSSESLRSSPSYCAERESMGEGEGEWRRLEGKRSPSLASSGGGRDRGVFNESREEEEGRLSVMNGAEAGRWGARGQRPSRSVLRLRVDEGEGKKRKKRGLLTETRRLELHSDCREGEGGR